MNTKITALTINGSNSMTVSKEIFNSMFELTKNGSNPKEVKPIDVDRLLNIVPDDISLSYLTELLADTVDCTVKNVGGKRKSRYNTWDKLTVPAKYFYEDQPEIETTIGRFLFNKFILAGSGIIGHTKYMNDVVNGGKLKDIDMLIGRLYMEDNIDRAQFNSYLDHRDTLGYWLNGMLAHTISEKMAKPLPQIEKKKAELCKKYEKEIAEHNIDVMTKIADELVAYAKEILKDDPGMDLYTSGDLDFNNNYKNNSIIKGAVKNEITGEFDFIDTSFMNGIKVKDIPAHSNSILASQYPASISTADSGYTGKKLLALLQMMEIDEPGSDCGTKNLIPVTITKYNKSDMLYTYFDEGGLKLLTPDNINQYIGKTLMCRSPMSCINEKICSKCAGKLFEMLDVKQAGLFAVQISHAALNLALKAKHNSVVALATLDVDNIIQDL